MKKRNKVSGQFNDGLIFLTRGPEQIRTAVEAFAELCLTTRPRDLILKKVYKSKELKTEKGTVTCY